MEHAGVLPRRNPVRAIIKAILHVLVKIVILVQRAIRRHPVVTLILLTMLVGAYFAIESGVVSVAWLGLPRTVSDGRPAAIAKYLDGQKNGDVSLMWEAVSDELKQDQEAFQSAQQGLTFAKVNGISLTDSSYVGGRSLSDGSSVHFMIVSLSNGVQTIELPRTFILDQSGKISGMK